LFDGQLHSWQANLIEGASFLAIGLIIIMYDFQIVNPIDFTHNGQGFSASLNPLFVLLFIIGFLFTGAGIAQAAVTYTIYKLEKRLRIVKLISSE
jgi:hypothetical protein